MSYKALDPQDFVISADSVTAPAWSTNNPTLTVFYTGSTCYNTSSFYIDVYNAPCSSTNAAVQFSIAYGHYAGSGSAPINSLVLGNSPSRITYGQYRNLVYGDSEGNGNVVGGRFNFGGTSTNAESIIAIPIDRNRYKESLLPGTFKLTLGSGSSYLNLTDNSNDVSTVTYLNCGRAFDIVWGSNGSADTTQFVAGYTTAGSYGLFLPDIGLIILNPAALALSPANGGLGHTFYTGTDANKNGVNYSAVYDFIDNGNEFTLQSKETVSSNYVFVRVRNNEFNYTSNPSFITGSGTLIYDNFINSPQTFITTVGMYNDANDLLAVAKLSKPLVKDFTKEALIRTKLDW
jgi:hypothetical protein